MPGPQVNYRLAVDGDRHRRTDLTALREVPGKRLTYPPEAGIGHAANGNISGCFAHHPSLQEALSAP